MERLIASIRKEWWVLIQDKVGLLLMFVMPIALVFIITLVQDSSFQMAKTNRLKILVVNDDFGTQGDSLVHFMNQSGAFSISNQKELTTEQMTTDLLENDRVLAIHIPKLFSKCIEQKASRLSSNLLAEFEVIDSAKSQGSSVNAEIDVLYDPVLQENYRQSISSSLQSFISQIESKLMIEKLYSEMGFDAVSSPVSQEMLNSSIQLKLVPASNAKEKIIPNSTQHNIPAWTIFALFFMVVSLGANLVRERVKGSYIRLQTIPFSYRLVVISKMWVYFFVSTLQISIIFSMGVWMFPLIGLPKLTLPNNLFPLLIVCLGSAASAISYAVLVGTYCKTLEQANGIGAISIIIFAAIGGIWVPSFIMPESLQTMGMVSPLHWCLDGFYKVFLEGASLRNLGTVLIYFVVFVSSCWLLVVWKMNRMRKAGL